MEFSAKNLNFQLMLIFFNNGQCPHQISVYIEFWTIFSFPQDHRLIETIEINARKKNYGKQRKPTR